MASKEGERGGKEEGGGGEGKDVTIAGQTNEQTNKDNKEKPCDSSNLNI